MANFRTDQFDNLPENIDRVGAHRGPKVKGRGWITVAWAVLATAVLVVGGLYVLSIFNSSIKFGLGGTSAASDTPSSTPVPVITPIDNPTSIASRNITVTVLNGTDIVGLDTKAAAKLTAKGWDVIATANSTATNLKTSTVYYSNAANQDVAEGIQSLLGAQDIGFTSQFPGSSITVVVGSDFSG
ncbi:MAG TPA: LytR C-terminal domain-containing protein [Galbitalea sp.]